MSVTETALLIACLLAGSLLVSHPERSWNYSRAAVVIVALVIAALGVQP